MQCGRQTYQGHQHVGVAARGCSIEDGTRLQALVFLRALPSNDLPTHYCEHPDKQYCFIRTHSVANFNNTLNVQPVSGVVFWWNAPTEFYFTTGKKKISENKTCHVF
jgi:hypothetical protein